MLSSNMTKRQLYLFTASLIAAFLVLYGTASTYSATNAADEAYYKAEELEIELDGQISTLSSKIDDLNDEVESMRWR
jgi:outer membrane murein-binding lipoprotein Lpp